MTGVRLRPAPSELGGQLVAAPSSPVRGYPETFSHCCGEITQPGRYHLDRDLRGSSGSACLRIHDTADVEIECHGHSVATDTKNLAAIVVETGKLLESLMRTVPLLVLIGSCAMSR